VKRLRRLVVAVVWFVVAILVALGGAGVATALNHPPATNERPELTWRGDQAAAPALDAATAKLQAMSDAVDALGASSKRALASLVAGDTAGLTATLERGTTQLAAVSAASTDLQNALAAIPYTGSDAALFVSPATTARYQQLAATPALTANLEADWDVLSARSMAASVVPDLLAKHDQETAAAAKEGEAGHYKQALSLLDAPDATLAEARTLRDSLAENADVTTLSQWIDLQGAYDASLRQLYTAMLSSKGKVTKAVRAAFAAEEAAKAALPGDTKGIVVIMGDIARGGLNQVVIDIEVARGSLAEALAAQQSAPGESAAPGESSGPGGSASPAPSSGPSRSAPAASGSPDVTPPP
jgi:hypothetical protein